MSHLEPDDIEAAAQGTAFPHLEGCAACREAVRDAKGRRALLKGLKPYTLSDVAFRRVEAKLAEQLEEGVPSGWRWVWWLLPAAAATAALVFFALDVSRPVSPKPAP